MDNDAKADSVPADSTTMFPHSSNARWWVSGQFNTILQGHPSFIARYSGPNSLQHNAEIHDFRVFTLYTGLQITSTTEAFLDAESAGGHGLSNGLGLMGLTNADVVRNPDLGPKPFLARVMIRQIVPLSSEKTEQNRGPLYLARQVPTRRLEFRVGKFALPDFFDLNGVGSDVHLQFMNLTIVNNAAYDYAANTRGYTYGALLEYYDRLWAVRFAEALMPTIPNGIDLDWNLGRAREENVELELRTKALKQRITTLRLLSFVSDGNRGDYREAVSIFLQTKSSRPAVDETRQQGRVKYGFGLNLEQGISDRWRAFARFSWNQSRYESYEVNQSVTAGTDYRGDRWHRRQDKTGVAFVTNAISRDVQTYFRLGGIGILIGDGGLNYGRESIAEWYYNAHLWRGLYTAVDLQHVVNPGYNRDRGPVWVPSFRLHVEI
ncbi:MAG: carbohydrate porin [Candidatus Sulfotelmatobacter sp.]